MAGGIVETKIEVRQAVEVRLRLVGQRRIGGEMVRWGACAVVRVHGSSAVPGGVPGRVLQAATKVGLLGRMAQRPHAWR